MATTAYDGVPRAGESSLAPAVTRAVRVLDVLAGRVGEPISLADLARQIGAAKSSTSNICAVLEQDELIRRQRGGYVLGRRTLELGGAYLSGFDQIPEFYRLCAEWPDLRQELVQAAVLQERDVLYLARHEGRTPLRLTPGAAVGDRFPAAITALGSALLAALPPAEVAARFRDYDFPVLTPRSTATLEQLLAKVAATRERGYALDQGEVFPNVVALAVVVPPRQSGDHTLAINISRVVPSDPPRLSAPERDHLIAVLHRTAEHLTNPMAFATPSPAGASS